MTLLSVAIIGAGNIAGGYDQNRIGSSRGVFSHAGAYRESGKFALATVYDVDAGRATAFQQHWQVGRLAASLEELCALRHDVISICTPDESHYGILKKLIASQCCRSIFVEKPIVSDLVQLRDLSEKAESAGIHVVVNFQRRHDPAHKALRDQIRNRPGELLSVSGYYMKGLHHSGVTMVDTLTYLCGYPEALLAYNRVFNRQVQDFSYEFVLFYESCTASVKVTDAEKHDYNYHIFEIDFLFRDRRITIINNSRHIRESRLGDYAYSGVKVLDDMHASSRETGFHLSMRDAADYVYGITSGALDHSVNTLEDSYINLLILNRIVESYERSGVKLNFEQAPWKK